MASPARADDHVAKAARAFAHAEASFREEDYAEALAFFAHAFALAPRDAVRFNMAVCLERLARFEEALETYQAAADSAELAPEERRRSREHHTRLRNRVAYLTVVAPNGAVVQVNGRACAAPCRAMVRVGVQRVSVRQDGAWHAYDVTSNNVDHTFDASGDGTTAQHAARSKPSRDSGADTTAAAVNVAPSFLGGAPSTVNASVPTASPLTPTGAGSATTLPRSHTLTYVGVPLAVAGTAVFGYFGVQTLMLKAEYEPERTDPELGERGTRSKNIANVALGAAVIGLVLVAVDQWLLPRSPAPAR